MAAIQNTIQVTKPTAMIDSEPPSASCASKVRVEGPKVRIAPKTTETVIAMPMPIHMSPIARVCPIRRR